MIPGNDQYTSPTNQKTAGNKLKPWGVTPIDWDMDVPFFEGTFLAEK